MERDDLVDDESVDAVVSETAIVHDIEELARERDDLRDLTQRLQADFENYKKRMMRQQTDFMERATEGLVEQLLPVLDNFAAALDHLDADRDVEQLRKGVELAVQELRAVLERNGLEVIDVGGVPFDPNVHDAVAHEAGEGEAVVDEVLRAGYRLKGRVLRPAMVKVNHDD